MHVRLKNLHRQRPVQHFEFGSYIISLFFLFGMKQLTHFSRKITVPRLKVSKVGLGLLQCQVTLSGVKPTGDWILYRWSQQASSSSSGISDPHYHWEITQISLPRTSRLH